MLEGAIEPWPQLVCFAWHLPPGRAKASFPCQFTAHLCDGRAVSKAGSSELPTLTLAFAAYPNYLQHCAARCAC
jgi:hypothetical protein